jgi:hypothetical protein
MAKTKATKVKAQPTKVKAKATKAKAKTKATKPRSQAAKLGKVPRPQQFFTFKELCANKKLTLALFEVAKGKVKNMARMFCTRKGITLEDCECDPKCIFLKKYTKDVWVKAGRDLGGS